MEDAAERDPDEPAADEGAAATGPVRLWHGVLTGAAPLAMAVTLLAMGRRLWCSCGSLAPGTLEPTGAHTSQHLLDPYTVTHVLHGLLFVGLLTLALGRDSSWSLRAALAAAIEAAWEVVENTDAVIERYREATIALGYHGDSVANSLADLAACLAGVALARWLPLRASVALFVAAEVTLLVWIRDSLLLNIVLLVWPIEALKTWQLGGG